MHQCQSKSRLGPSLLAAVCFLALLPPALLANGIIISPPPEQPPSDIREPRPPFPHPPRPIDTWTPFSIASQRLDVAINDLAAETTVEQVFVNRCGRQVEGTYLFPIPESAAVHDFTMWMNGREVTAELLDAAKARQIYESIVAKMRDPALLEVAGCGLIQARVFPIPQGGECRIKLKYSELLPSDAGLISYRFPLGRGPATNRPIERFSLRAVIQSTQPLAAVFSPSHDCSIDRRGDREAVVGLEKGPFQADNDFQILFKSGNEAFGLALLTYRSYSEDGFFMARISPRVSGDHDPAMPKNICFVLDTSGSMADDNKIAQAKKALKFCLTNLGKEDRFNLITFSTEVRPFRADWCSTDDTTLAAARSFVDDLKAVGGTDINAALQQALSLNPARSKIDSAVDPGGSSWRKNPYFIVFITDGEPTVGVVDPAQILKNVAESNAARDARLFVLGVGFQVNTKLLDRMADDNGGARDYVTPSEDLELKISGFYTKLANPILAGLKLQVDGVSVSDVYPKVLPDLFRGSELVVVGRYGSSSAEAHTIKLTGTTRGDLKTYTYDCRFATQSQPGNDFLPRVWAVRKIGYLLDELRLRGDNKELREEVIRLSKLYGIMTPYTSFLVMEDEKRAVRLGQAPTGGRGVPQALHDAFARNDKAMAGEAAGQAATTGPSGVEASMGNLRLRAAAPAKAGTLMDDIQKQNQTADGRNTFNFVGAKTFYLENDRWVDAQYDGKAKTNVLKLYSPEYYAFVAANAGAGQFLAQGDRVVVCWKDQVYETMPPN